MRELVFVAVAVVFSVAFYFVFKWLGTDAFAMACAANGVLAAHRVLSGDHK